MGDNFERSVGGMNPSNFGLYESGRGDPTLKSQIEDISIFALDKGSYDDTLNAINNFLRKESTVDDVASERNRIIKELYGNMDNYLEEENFFMTNGEF